MGGVELQPKEATIVTMVSDGAALRGLPRAEQAI